MLALLAALLAAAVLSAKGPLQDIHWDAPIYLQRARAFAETPYLREFAANAQKIADELASFKADRGISTPYWSFIRIGNTTLLGTLTMAAGPGTSAIFAAFWTYIGLLVAAIMLMAKCAVCLLRLLGTAPEKPAAAAGGVVAAGLYMVSDVARHLAGNFVAEVPALFLLAASSLALVRALTSRSKALAVVSGIGAFLLYVVKMDAIWAYLGFLLLLSLALLRGWLERGAWPVLLSAAVTALAIYVAYAIVFWPLPDPRLILLFQRAHDESPGNSVLPIKLFVAAGGLLWVGVALALVFARRERALWFALGWLGLVFLPYAPSIFQERPTQVRIFALVMPPLMIAATVGASAFVGRWRLRRLSGTAPWLLGGLILLAVAVSHAEPYAVLRRAPGGWRLQYVKEWLSPPNYERLSYPLADLQKLATFLYGNHVPTVLVIDRPKNAELVNLIEVLRPPGWAPVAGARTDQVTFCGRVHDFSRGALSSCLVAPSKEEFGRLDGQVRVLYLQRLSGDPLAEHPAAGRTVFESGPLALRAWSPG